MASRILALKIRSRDGIHEIEGALREYEMDLRERLVSYDLLKVPEAGHTLLRLSRVDAVIVSRNDYGPYAPELAEVYAWIRAVQRQSHRKVPLAVYPCPDDPSVCAIAELSTTQKSCHDGLTECFQRVDVLSNQAHQDERTSRAPNQQVDVRALATLLAQAVGAGWTTPDGEVSPKLPLGALPDAIWEWIHRRPALARAVAADAIGWLAYKAASTGQTAKLSGVNTSSDSEQVLSCALAWALDAAAATRGATSEDATIDRSQALATGTGRRVAIVWQGGNTLQFRLALRALLLEQIATEEPAPGPREPDHGFADLVARQSTSALTRPLDSGWVAPIVNVNPDNALELFATARPVVAFAVADRDLSAVKEAAVRQGRYCIVLRERDLGDLLDKTESKARSFADQTSHS